MSKANATTKNDTGTKDDTGGGTDGHEEQGEKSDDDSRNDGGTGKKPPPAKFRAFHGAADVDAAHAKMKLVQLAEEIINVLRQDPNATVKVCVEISVDFPHGAPDHVKRAVTENANALGLTTKD
ncbi:MAG TPA: hypothetical protein VM533_00380 [Fimbriiglobus sp.]|nr:hypothetical protein [Fimbriiglobus sp.]